MHAVHMIGSSDAAIICSDDSRSARRHHACRDGWRARAGGRGTDAGARVTEPGVDPVAAQRRAGLGHSHGLISASIKRSRSGLRAVSLSLVVLLVTSAAQAVVFIATGSVALLADLIHNFGDALTAVPLGIAFLLRSFVAEKRAGY